MINRYTVNLSLFLLGFLNLIFILFPNLDLIISNLFYIEDIGFVYKRHIFALSFFYIIPLLTKLLGIFLFLYLLYLYIKHKNIPKILKSKLFLLLIILSISPGLTVNFAFKENFGRARPSQIKEFSGTKEFSRSFAFSNQCKHNCSFSSGHAAMGFYFSVFAYIFGKIYFNRIYILGILFGCLVGFSRILMGGHFFSDVIASGFVVLLLNHLIYLLWIKLSFKLEK